MIQQGITGSLNDKEKRIVKYLVNQGWTNQDIQALVNLERPATINFARISGVKSDVSIQPCSKEEFEDYQRFKRSFDLKTGLNPFTDEKLIKSREAMKLAVSVFNNPSFQFRAENFSMFGPVTLSCRSDCSFKRPFVRRPRGFSTPMLSAFDADCRSH